MDNYYEPCSERGCKHPAEAHPMAPEDDLPEVLWSCPCSVPGCECTDYDGMQHPQRPPLIDVEIYRDDDGGVGVRSIP
jgi:hypothetical protein